MVGEREDKLQQTNEVGQEKERRIDKGKQEEVGGERRSGLMVVALREEEVDRQ